MPVNETNGGAERLERCRTTCQLHIQWLYCRLISYTATSLRVRPQRCIGLWPTTAGLAIIIPVLLCVRVIYEGTKGTLFDWGTVPSLFRMKKVTNLLLSPTVNRGDLQRLKYNKTIFSRTPLREFMAYFLPVSSTLVAGSKGSSFSLWLVCPTFRPKLRPFSAARYLNDI